MNYTVVSAKVDPQTKKEAMATAYELGMPLSVVIKAFLKQFIRTKSVFFSVREERPSEYLRSVMREAEKNYKKGHKSPPFSKAEDAVAFLEKQGI